MSPACMMADVLAAELISADLGESLDWRHTVYQDLFKTVHGSVILLDQLH